MRLKRCDNCGKEEDPGTNWFLLEETGPQIVSGGTGSIIIGGRRFDLCSRKCVIEFMQKESE